jgi:F-type H+-transporting ATPase subunit b
MFHFLHNRPASRACAPRVHCRGGLHLLIAVLLLGGVLAAPMSLTAAPQHEAAAAPQHEGAAAETAPHGQTLTQTLAKLANFAILAGVLVYYLRSPIRTYLTARATAIRSDLVAAAEMRATATAQLADIERKLQSLPGELAALKAQGAQDVAAEQARIAQAAAAERERLIQQTHREIQMRLQVARRQLTEHAAQLAVQLAEQRIKQTITPADQLRLVERYTAQLGEAR